MYVCVRAQNIHASCGVDTPRTVELLQSPVLCLRGLWSTPISPSWHRRVQAARMCESGSGSGGKLPVHFADMSKNQKKPSGGGAEEVPSGSFGMEPNHRGTSRNHPRKQQGWDNTANNGIIVQSNRTCKPKRLRQVIFMRTLSRQNLPISLFLLNKLIVKYL